MNAQLNLRQSQHLTLTPQLQQSIRLLQLSTLELNQEVEKVLMENPLLELDSESDDVSLVTPSVPMQEPTTTRTDAAEPGEESEPQDWSGEEMMGGQWQEPEEEPRDWQQENAPLTLVDHLLSQLRLLSLSERDHEVISELLSQLDEEGYLGIPLEELVGQGPESAPFEQDELQVSLKLLQSLDPVGVGARSLAECLCLQLSSLPAQTPGLATAQKLGRDHLPLLAQHDFARLKKLLHINDEELKLAHHLIRQLDPRPGARFVQLETRFVAPDVSVKKVRGRWKVTVNSEVVPRLRINRLYAEMLGGRRQGQASMSNQLQEARWFIRNIQQRFETIQKVSQAIVDRQDRFLEHGEVAMRPLVLREIAEQVGLHESTISRVTTQKYMMTPRGLYELKYFFSSHVGTESGGAASSTAIRALIRQLVESEDARKPLSDNRISDILGEQGIVVARRTVAKYRESLQIQPASQRKTL
jgi:RNA polymerase sigma-54 factor